MRWRRIAFWSGFGLLALIVLAISWLLLADLGSFKPQIERWASEKTGRTIAINGPLNINLAAQSSVVAEDISISNADWAAEPEMLSVGRVEVQLNLRSLFSDTIIINLIDVDDARLLLEKPAEGDPNWELIKRDPDTKPKPTGEKKVVLLKQIDVDRVELMYADAVRAKPLDLYIEQFTQQHRDDDFLQVAVEGTLNDRAVKINGEVGTWRGMLGKQDVQFDVGARINNLTLNASGYIDDLGRPYRPRINFDAAVPDVNEVLQLLGVEHPGEGEIDLVGSLQPQDQGPLVLDVAGAVGRLDIEAVGEVSDLRDLEHVDIKLLASGEDIRPILEAFGIHQTRSSPFMINVDAARHGSTFIVEEADMVFGQARFGLSARLPQFPRPDDAVINLQINGPDIVRFREVFRLPGAATGPFSAAFTVDVGDDGVEILNLDLETSLGKIHADGALGDAPDYFDTTLDFEILSPNLATIGSAYGIDRLPEEPAEIRGSAVYGPDGIRTRDSLSLTVKEVEMLVDGLIKPVKGLLGSDFEFTIDGPDLAALIGAFAPSDKVPVQPYAVNGQLQIRDDGYRFRDVSGTVGTSEVDIDGLLVPRRRIVGSRFNFAARGAVFDEIIAQLGEFDVAPGPYDLHGSVIFEAELIDFDAVQLTRANGQLELDMQLGMPISRRWINIDALASGPNVQALLRSVRTFEADAAPFTIDIDGRLRDTTWSIDNVDVSVGLAKLTGQGTLDLRGDTAATQFDFDVNIPDISKLGTVQGNRMREQSFILDATVTGDGSSVLLENLRAQLGESDIGGDIKYKIGDQPKLDVYLVSESLVFAPLIERPENQVQPGPRFPDGRVIPDVAIPFDAMARMDATIQVDIADMRRDALRLRDIVVRAELADGALDISEISFQAAAGALMARGRLDPDGGNGKANLDLVARDFAFGMSATNQDLSMTSDIDIKLESTGNDLRALTGNASGVVYLDSRGGRVPNNRFMQALYGDLLDEIIGTINPFSETEEFTDFECMIVPMELSSGMMLSNPNSLIATSRMRIVAESEVDLKDESLEVSMRTTPKRGISISAGEIVNPYVKIVGTLAEPGLAVDETGVLISGGAAVATGGLSVLARAAWTRLSRSKDPCGELAEESKEALSSQFPDLTVRLVEPDTAEQPTTEETAQP